LVRVAGGAYSFATFVPASGMATCTSNGRVLDLHDSPRVKSQQQNPKADVVVIRNGMASGTSVLAFGNPVYDEVGVYLGYVSISMPHRILETATLLKDETRIANLHEPLALITFDADGNVLTSTTGLDDAPNRLPKSESLATLAKSGAQTFTETSRQGVARVYAVFPVIDGSIYAIGSWPNVEVAGPLSLQLSPYLMPALMWLASLLVAVLASERLITRHIQALRTSMTAFAAGNQRVANLEMPNAAVEIRDVTDAYLKMTDTILHDEAELEDMVHQREVLLREVHHRVKNNLQLIASIMNMQMRQSHSVEAKTLMKGLQDRVMSLATIHRGLYQTTGLTDVRADELLSDILRQILKMSTGPGRRFDVVTGFDDIQLTPDQAVPLSLLLTEALTNAIKYAGGDMDHAPRLEVTLRRRDATHAVLTVSNDIGGAVVEPDQGTGLGAQLMTAFAQQLGGDTTVQMTDKTYRLEVTFAVLALQEAEAGKAPMAADGQA
jgi:two-component system, sensor histidine kinase PdtaS